MENKNILTTEEALVKKLEALKAETAELVTATENLAKAVAGSAAPVFAEQEISAIISGKSPGIALPELAAEKTEAGPEATAAEVTAEEPDGEEAAEEPAEEAAAEEVPENEEPETEVEEQAEETPEEKSETAEGAKPEEETSEGAAPEEKTPEAEETKKTGKASNVIFTLLRIVLVAALVAAIVFYVFLRNRESTVPASDVFKKVEQTVKTEKMEKTTDRYFKKYYGLNAADYDSVLYYAPVSNMDAEELLVIKLKNSNQAEAVTDAILKRQSDKEQSFEGYAPEQYALAQDYILDVQGNYILFVVDPKAEEIDNAFAGAL